jgi:hypothetical protein
MINSVNKLPVNNYQAEKNREILNKLNSNDLAICNILNELSKKVDRLASDLESVKSYINRQEEHKKLSIQQDKNISSGWWFS